MDHFTSFSFGVVIALNLGVASAADGQIGNWKLTDDCQDSSGAGRHAVNHGVRFTKDGAVFNGRDAWLEATAAKVPQLGTGAFTIST